MLTVLVTAAALAGATAAPSVRQQDDCRYTAERTADASADGISVFDLEAGAGSLRIVGKAGISTIQVRGHVCASSQALLAEAQLQSRRDGGTYYVKTPDANNHRYMNNEYSRTDLVIEVPAAMMARVDDGSGDAVISGIGRLEVNDGSGELEIFNIGGDLTVDDGSGDLIITGVRGDVMVEDGSGEIRIRDVQGSVTVSDGSGSINVAKVGGNFTVRNDGSGDVEQSDVAGEVRVPGRNRRGRR